MATNFVTRIFSEQGGQTIGCEVTVYSDQGDRLEYITVTDAESITELQQRLAVIDETYFTEERLQEILANAQETNEINATHLSGFNSSDFAKVSQLSNYSRVGHTHGVGQIIGLYDFQITSSAYNVDIGSNVTITVKVINRATNRGVVGLTVPVLKNNSTWQSGTTGVNGTFQLTYTADTWGLTTFSADTSSTQINVTGYKTQTLTGVTVYYTDHEVNAVLNHTQNLLSCTTSEWKDLAVSNIPSGLTPKIHQFSPSLDSRVRFRVNANGKLQYQSDTYLQNVTVQANFSWLI